MSVSVRLAGTLLLVTTVTVAFLVALALGDTYLTVIVQVPPLAATGVAVLHVVLTKLNDVLPSVVLASVGADFSVNGPVPVLVSVTVPVPVPSRATLVKAVGVFSASVPTGLGAAVVAVKVLVTVVPTTLPLSLLITRSALSLIHI